MAFAFLSIFISVTLIFPYSYSNNREFSAERQINLENFVFDVNVIYNVTARSLIGCIVHCMQFVNCMSVHFSRSTKECLGVNIGYVVDSVAIGRISSNWSYYLVLDGRCPRKTGYVYNDVFDSCYRFQAKDSLQHLFDYDQTCAEVGAELITIDSTAKQQHIVKHLSQFNIPRSQWTLIQGISRFTNDPWKYNNGSLMTYFYWHPTQPDITVRSGQSEHIGMRPLDGYKWHDLWPNYKGSFICEKLLI